jgi:hypothetical protein
MLDRLRAILKRAGTPVTFDASRFNDPVALQVEWSPKKGGGTNFRTHKLVLVDFNRMEFKTTFGAFLFYLVFLLTGAGISSGFAVYSFMNETGTGMGNFEMFMPFLTGILFFALGIYLYYNGAKPVVFDKRYGYFWKCWKAPDEAFNPDAMEEYTKLSDIHAIQIISEFIRGDKSSYYSYELNLVLNDGARVNVVDHGNKEKLRADAQILADFLGKPVWDAT